MKKFFLTLILSTLSLVGFSQNDSTRKDSSQDRTLCLNTTVKVLGYTLNTPRLQTYYQPTPYVGVNLRLNTSKSYHDEDTRKAGFVCLFITGIAFTTAAILEGGYQYGSYQNGVYVTPSIWQQTPRQIMLCVGIGFTLVGGIGTISVGK